MKTEDKVCSLKQSIRLVELGVVLTGIEKCWYRGITNDWHIVTQTLTKSCIDVGDGFPAPDVAELGVLLPLWYDTEYQSPCVDFYKTPNGFFGGRIELATNKPDKLIYAKTEAQARAAALIWLLENDYLKPEDCSTTYQ